MSARPIYPDQIITKAVTLARKHGRQTDTTKSEAGPVLRSAEFGRFVIELSAIPGTEIKATSVTIFLDGEGVFWAVFKTGWEKDADTKLLHWGPSHEWRSDFMKIQANKT